MSEPPPQRPIQGRASLDSAESHVLDAPPIPPPKVDTSDAPHPVDSTTLDQHISVDHDAPLEIPISTTVVADEQDDAESWTQPLSTAQQVHAAHSDSKSDEHDALGVMIELVQKLGALLQQSARDKADMETQLTLSKSNLQLALANTEMLEDALRDRGATTRDVGWRRSRPPGDLEPPFTPNSAPAPTTPRSATVPTPQTAPPAKDTRFLARFRFGATPPTTTTQTQATPPQTSPVSPARQTTDTRSHLTSASVPNLALASERQLPALSINPASNPNSQDNTPQTGAAGPNSSIPSANVGTPGSAVFSGAPPLPPTSAASPAHPGGGMQTYSGPGGTFYVAGGGVNSWQFQAQRAARFELELQKERTAKAALEAELESLSQALFEEANNMVAQERRARAAADEELNSTRAQRDALHAALQVVERENGVLRGGHWTPASDGARSRADSGASVSSVVGVRAGIDGEAFKLAQSAPTRSATIDSNTTLKHRPSPLHDLQVSSSSPAAIAEGSSPIPSGVGTPIETDSEIEFAPAPRGLPDRSTDLGNVRASGRKRLAAHAEEGEEEEDEEEETADAHGTGTLQSPDVEGEDLYTPRVDGGFPKGVGVVERKESGTTPEVPGGFPKN